MRVDSFLIGDSGAKLINVRPLLTCIVTAIATLLALGCLPLRTVWRRTRARARDRFTLINACLQAHFDGLIGVCHNLHGALASGALIHGASIVFVVAATLAFASRRRFVGVARCRSRCESRNASPPSLVRAADECERAERLLLTTAAIEAPLPPPPPPPSQDADAAHDRSFAIVSLRWHVALLVVFAVSVTTTLVAYAFAPLDVNAEIRALNSAIRFVRAA